MTEDSSSSATPDFQLIGSPVTPICRLNNVDPESFVKKIVSPEISLEMLERSLPMIHLNGDDASMEPRLLGNGAWESTWHVETMTVPLSAAEQGVVTTVATLATGNNMRRMLRAAAPGSIEATLWALNYFDISTTTRNSAIGQLARLLFRDPVLHQNITDIDYRIWTPELIAQTVERGGATNQGRILSTQTAIFLPRLADGYLDSAWRMSTVDFPNHAAQTVTVDVVVPHHQLPVVGEPDIINVQLAQLYVGFATNEYSNLVFSMYSYLSDTDKWWFWLMSTDNVSFADVGVQAAAGFNRAKEIFLPDATWIDHVISYAAHDIGSYEARHLPLSVGEFRSAVVAFKTGFITAFAERTRNWNVNTWYYTRYGGSINVRPHIVTADVSCYMWWPDLPLWSYMPLKIYNEEIKTFYTRRTGGVVQIGAYIGRDHYKSMPRRWASTTDITTIDYWDGPTPAIGIATGPLQNTVMWSLTSGNTRFVLIPTMAQSVPGFFREDELMEPIVVHRQGFNYEFYYTRRVESPAQVQVEETFFRPVRFHV